ncbi:hypothetical protein [Dethiosulfovibrio salsuginis]|uniref:Uncharacterized protein n=1 Tax=Dethiosulfovibrio salsuginis TaxID=561720 RepID=A0A1X7IQH2_9BACT|nr:hypothetical protein [Dethiosulfovibrio salsuginis]SMG17368.1 hypothetical protein SAMN06275492_10452 [Dethiosulfovibrio salsuginis]
MKMLGLAIITVFLAVYPLGAQEVQQFEHGLVDWERGLVLVEGRVPLSDQGSPSSRLRSQRAARLSLFMNVFRVSSELTGLDLPENLDIGEDLFKEVVVTGGERDGDYVLWAWFPLERVKGLTINR